MYHNEIWSCINDEALLYAILHEKSDEKWACYLILPKDDDEMCHHCQA